MAVKKRHLDLLRPFLIGEQSRVALDAETGEEKEEWYMYCPLHNDSKRSASMNLTDGVWFCAGCGNGGRITKLITQQDEWVDPPALGATPKSKNGSNGKVEQIPSEAMIHGWVSALQASQQALSHLTIERGIDETTIDRFDIGWNSSRSYFTIPVRNLDGQTINVRRYNPAPKADQRKIWGLSGHNSPVLYPIEVLKSNPKEIIICEGEWDALLTNQFGFPTVTRTGAADVWNAAWGSLFEGKRVYLCHDCDTKGLKGNRKVGRLLIDVAESVRVVKLPYPIVEKHGKDLTDYWHDGHTAMDFRKLLDTAQPFGSELADPIDIPADDVSVLDTFDPKFARKPLRVTVTIKGKREPGYSTPSRVKFSCSRDAGNKCNICPLYAKPTGEWIVDIAPNDPVTLELLDSTSKQLKDILRNHKGIQKCDRLDIEPIELRAVEELYARPSVDHASGHSPGDYKTIKITSVGRHDTPTNNTVQVVGALHPGPRNQRNEFLAWEVDSVETSIDNFQLEPEVLDALRVFQPEKYQRPLKKLGDIARDIAAHVTHIYGRPEMHAAMDLVFHSALAFNFDEQYIHRGWLELLIVGDTRTGKSEAAKCLVEHYGFGEMVSCESATIAGILGGLQQYGSSGEWAINWGVIPINDRRLVVLDEAGGLSPEEIAQLSSVRSSGEAQLTKIQSEKTHARTRTIWLANDRDGRRMAEYAYGVQAIQALIGNPEDIARFDLAMSVATGEVPMEEINRSHHGGRLVYSSALCSALVRWVASRRPEQIEFTDAATRAVYHYANELGRRYVEDPPLIQAANVRTKIARVAVALAARTFSTDSTRSMIVIEREHVRDSVLFLDRIYSMQGFGYAERSREAIKDRNEAKRQRKPIKRYLGTHENLAKFMRSNGKFRRQDLEEVLNMSREQANSTINTLWKARMIRKDKGDVRIEPTLNEILREINE